MAPEPTYCRGTWQVRERKHMANTFVHLEDNPHQRTRCYRRPESRGRHRLQVSVGNAASGGGWKLERALRTQTGMSLVVLTTEKPVRPHLGCSRSAAGQKREV